jgi:hypothetical protein
VPFGRLPEGVSILSRLFVLSEDPTFIFNQGRCFEQSRRYEDAIARFQEYLRTSKNLDPEGREEANSHIAECQKLLVLPTGQGAAGGVAPAETHPKEPATGSARTATPPPSVPAPVEVIPKPAFETVHAPGSGLRTAGVITAVAGAAVLVAGVLLNLKVNSMTDELEQPDGYTDARDSTRKTYKTAASVSYGFGAACVAAGGILYILGLRLGVSSSSVAWTPALGPGQVGAVVDGRF